MNVAAMLAFLEQEYPRNFFDDHSSAKEGQNDSSGYRVETD
jgi:hypothetical protein